MALGLPLVSLGLVAAAVLVLVVPLLTAAQLSPDINCDALQYTIDEPDDTLAEGPETLVCGVGGCCSGPMEKRLQEQSRKAFETAVREDIEKQSKMVRIRGQKYQTYLKELLAASKSQLHTMFKRTYGMLYEQNAQMFAELFDQLDAYRETGRVHLDDALDAFFARLYQRMFTVLNAQFLFDDRYLSCVAEHMKALRPFGEEPKLLSVRLKRALVAARAFAQALQQAADSIGLMARLPTSRACQKAVTRMSACPSCRGLPDLKACSNFCANVMKGCLAYQSELNTDWNAFVDAMDRLGDRLSNSFNIESVVPIHIKISDAIMNFQENAPKVSQKIFDDCGKPELRRTPPEGGGHGSGSLREHHRRRRRDSPASSSPSTVLTPLSLGLNTEPLQMPRGHARLLKDTRQRLKDSRDFWAHLPYRLCHKLAAGPENEEQCWNGLNKARYEPQVAASGLSGQRANPEVPVVGRPQSAILDQQQYLLRTLTAKLRNAYNGQDVAWQDDEDALIGGSGSGSGDGSDLGLDLEGSGMGSGPEGPGGRDTNQRGHHPAPTTIPPSISRGNTTSSSAAPNPPRLTLLKAVAGYLLPIVLAWLGSAFADHCRIF